MWDAVYVLTDRHGAILRVVEEIDAALLAADLDWQATKGPLDGELVWTFKDDDRSLTEAGGWYHIARYGVRTWYQVSDPGAGTTDA